MKRYQRVNLCNGDKQSLKQYSNFCTYIFEDVEDHIKTASTEMLPEDKRSSLSSALNSSCFALYFYHFEYVLPPIKPLTFISSIVEVAKEFFYCEKKTKNKWISWNRQFYIGTLFSLLKNDRQSLQKISRWVDHAAMAMNNKHPFDISTSATINYFSPLFFALAQYFCEEPHEKYVKEINCIKEGTRSVIKTFLKIWESIDSQDSNAFKKQFVQLVNKHIQKSAKTKPPGTFMPGNIISEEATWMWNIALRSGMEMPELPEEIMDRIVTPQSIGLE
jgi:hypothetical protein